MKDIINLGIRLCAIGLLLATTAKSSILFTIDNTSLVSTDPTQLGRLNRNGVVSDWSTAKPFPGVLNPTTSYHYHTYIVPVLNAPFIQISIDDDLVSTFASAYLNSYNPASLSSNYLGDAGFSGNPFPGDPAFFQVVVPAFSNLVVVVNDTSTTGAGVGENFSLLVEGFIDTNFTDPPPIPEPAGVFLTGTGLFLLGLTARTYRRGRR
jgi:hypothetical protein